MSTTVANDGNEPPIVLPPGVERPTPTHGAADAGEISILGSMRILSELMNREGIASRAGVTFGGKRDLYKALGYERRLKPKDYRWRYKRNAIAARIVEALPKATWRGTVKLTEDGNNEQNTEFEQATRDLARLKLWSTFVRADIVAGLCRYIGARGELYTPLPELRSPDDVFFLSVLGEADINIDRFVEDPLDERFGLPLLYSSGRMSKNIKDRRKIHWSRMIHVADGCLDDEVHGTPRMERSWNLLDDLEKVSGGGSEAFWLRAHQGYVANIDKDVKLSPEQLTDLHKQVEEFAHQLRRTVGQRGTKLTALGSDVARFGDQVEAILTQISGGSGIPKRVLTGSERERSRARRTGARGRNGSSIGAISSRARIS